MLTNLAKGFLIDVWRGSEWASECTSIKSYKKSCSRSYPEKQKFSLPKITQVLENQKKDKTVFFGIIIRNYF